MEKVVHTARRWSVVDARDAPADFKRVATPDMKGALPLGWPLGATGRIGSAGFSGSSASGAGSGGRLSPSSLTSCGTPPDEARELGERTVRVLSPQAKIESWMTRRIGEIAALLEAAAREPGEAAQLGTAETEALARLKRGFLTVDGMADMSPTVRDAALRVLVRSYELLGRLEREHPVAGALFPQLLRDLCNTLSLHHQGDHLQAVLEAIPGGDALEGLPARSRLPADMLQAVFGPWFGPLEGRARQAFIDRVAARLVQAPAAEQTSAWLAATVGSAVRCVSLSSRGAGPGGLWDSLAAFVDPMRDLHPDAVKSATLGLMWGVRPLGGTQDDEESLRLGLRRIVRVLAHPEQFRAVGAGLQAWLAQPGMPATAADKVMQALKPVFTMLGKRLPFATAATCAVNLAAGVLGEPPQDPAGPGD